MFYCRGMRGSVKEDEWQIEEECSHWNCAFCQAVRWTVCVCLLPDCPVGYRAVYTYSSVCSRHYFTLSWQELLIRVHLLTHLALDLTRTVMISFQIYWRLPPPCEAQCCSWLQLLKSEDLLFFFYLSFITVSEEYLGLKKQCKVTPGSGKLCWAFWDFFVGIS